MGKIAQDLLIETRAFLAGSGPLIADFIAPWALELPERTLEEASLPCLDHLDACAASAEGGSGEELARLLAERGQRLRWGQTYTASDFGQDFLDNYGWLELVGTRGHFVDDNVACGFLLLGPGVHYPDHHHEAEEIYIPLTGGALWRKGDGEFAARAAGEIIHHPSHVNHAMRTGDDPLLALYLWRGGPLAARSIVTGRAG
ncbi:dimethylsulfonioproprionate lyase family protein [Mesorhizobium australicum]|uniref:Dimethylsulfoniopropionate lyase DddQ n=1 Tax=Mesorhizobium australicum TaxID=536018 RepID=A0A1X7PGD2_9HYPH|nr:dimethylsulfonioproprionate lyase family protein [Mesorhizobium australicum]SMH49792.1 dimethylsulfoniopropionate lyase DddQ [Mesorhizobium australicum]